jgi:phosphoribosylanthranilate isomerase
MGMSAAHTADSGLAEIGQGTHVKVCGIVEPAELDVLAANGIDFVGLWYGVAGGPHDLPLESWSGLAARAAASGHPAPVLVTFAKDPELLREALERSGARWVQPHGYQTPGFVKKLKAIAPDVRILKVLHVRGQECLEARLVGSYERAGVDVFLFDAVSEDGRVGSTGQTLDPGIVTSLADTINRPFLLAGGISAENRDEYSAVAAHPRFLGIDVDTNARGADGKIRADHVQAISRAWKARADA